MSNALKCSKCGATGRSIQFDISSKHGFGKYCVPCEKKVEKGK